ncbi:hypothetical protein [Pseudonocardia lacus]|uniref:hypothetical protein n=1 Tax=Pseudonocardia lacus TaxID=2835865 RepID=UPI001BDCB7FA|nr:hypothetical protein [Pseudonocardia lacus]
MQHTDALRTTAWLIMGSTGSTPGVLELVDGRVRFTAAGRGALTGGQLTELERRSGRVGLVAQLDRGSSVTVFDAPRQAVTEVKFPWYYFGGGMKLTVEKAPYRFSFLQPQNTQEWPGIDGIPGGRAAGKLWRAALG